ncbi:MAG: hypothetical protein WBM19_07045 [Azonexus sp.]
MRKISYVIPLVGALFLSTTPAIAQVSIGIGLPGVSIGVNFPVYPQLTRIPGYPVYYAPQADSNYFFYDGMYWVYQEDNWYASSWYNGPWEFVGPQAVPLYVLRIPVRYYRAPPAYFRGWQRDAPPRWDDHWGNDWAQQRHGWDRWNRGSAPAPAPLPTYQRQYAGDRYPHEVEQQRNIHNEKYRYQPRDALVRQREQAPPARMAPAPAQQDRSEAHQQDRQRAPQQETQRSPDTQRAAPPAPSRQGAQFAPRPQPQQRSGEEVQRAAPTQSPDQQRGPAGRDQMQPARQAPAQHQQQAPAQRQQQAPAQHQQQGPQEQGRGQGQEKERESGDGRGQGQGQGRNR